MIGHPLKVRELLDEIARGEVLLPEIQRAYVWKGPQVAKLLDSLYREFPSGQLLLWDTVKLPITRHLAGVEQPPLPSAGQPKIVLDGQQRLTSLYKALGQAKDPVEVWFNLETEQFERFSRRLGADPRWVSTRDVINGRIHDLQILARLEKAGLVTRDDDTSRLYLDRLQRLRRIGEYKFPIEIHKTDDYEDVTELFVRINSSGTRLRAAELVLAQLALRLPGALVEKFEQALDEYSEVGFELDSRFLVRALIAVGTGQSRFRYLTEFWKKDEKEIARIWERAHAGIDATVNFVRQNARFESSEWLQSLNALVPLTAFFVRHTKVTPKVEGDLLRWFYLASLRGRYSGSGETAMDEDLKAVAGDEPVDALLKNVLPPGSIAEVAPEEFDDAGARNALFPLTCAAARKRGAKDWFTGVGLATDVVGKSHAIEIHHVFPKAVLRDAGASRRDRDEIANLAFLTAAPNKKVSNRLPSLYLAEIAGTNPERLEAQCIPLDQALWEVSRFQDFLAERRRLLAGAVNDLLAHPISAG